MQNILIIGNSPDKIQKYIYDISQKYKITKQQTYTFGQNAPLLIEEFRDILKLSQHYFTVPTAFVIHNFNLFSSVLQNTFLKTLEEHQTNLIFILVASKSANILPTIKSRCLIKTINTKLDKPTSQDFNLIQQQINSLIENPRKLISKDLKLFKNKKEKVLEWLDLFIRYGYFNLKSYKNKPWLSKKLKKAIRYYHLIETNNLDPEITLDNIFFG